VSSLSRNNWQASIVDQQGRATPAHQRYLNDLDFRVGGANAPTIKEINTAVAAAQSAAEAAALSAQVAQQAASGAYGLAQVAQTKPRDKGLTVDDLIPVILSLQSSVANLSQEVARLRNLETYSMVTR
jgi:hypothetical protein